MGKHGYGLRNRPNEYTSIEQMNEVFEFLNLIGWKFNEENNIWWKKGIKNEDGTFVNVIPEKNKLPTEKVIDVDVVYNPELSKKMINGYNKECAAHMYSLRQGGLKLREIAIIYDTSISTVYTWLQRFSGKK